MQPSAATILLGGVIPPTLADQIDQGLHPRVEYLEVQRALCGQVLSYSDIATSSSRVVRAAGGRSAKLALGLRSSLYPRDGGAVLATGEDVGLPLSLIRLLSMDRRPIYILMHGSYFGSRKVNLIKALLRVAKQVRLLCLSESLRSYLIGRLHVPENRVVNVGYGVDTQFFSPRAHPADSHVEIVSAGMANRDYRTLVTSVAGINARLTIAADSAWFRCGLDIADQDLPDNVQVRSCGDYVGLRALYAKASFVVVPLYEALHACGYAVIAEAMAMGKTVIATKTANCSDYIVEGVTGFHVSPGDTAALRERILFLLNHPDIAAQMGNNARCRMEQHFSIGAFTGRIVDAMGTANPG